jgi:hypothetical protein
MHIAHVTHPGGPKFSDEKGPFAGPFSAGDRQLTLNDAYAEICGRVQGEAEVRDFVLSRIQAGMLAINRADGETNGIALYVRVEQGGGTIVVAFPTAEGRTLKGPVRFFVQGHIGEANITSFARHLADSLRPIESARRSA